MSRILVVVSGKPELNIADRRRVATCLKTDHAV